MTQAEAKYWKEYIEKVITSKLSALSNTEEDAAVIRSFSERFMQTITGQQLLPQQIFRIFLDLFARIPTQQETLNEKIAWIEEHIEEFADQYVLLTDAELEDIVVDEITVVAYDSDNDVTITITREDRTPTQEELDVEKLTWHDSQDHAFYTDIVYNTTDHKSVYIKSGSDYLPIYNIISIS